jgi:hypothetical protein
MHSPEEGLAARGFLDRIAQPAFLERAHAIGHRTLAGKTTRSAARIAPGSPVISTASPGATRCSAFWTERRLPMP